jgi:4-methyl-5(b-hydroxyethyl)-thiazole monophosphate biosynthesis
MVVVPGGLWGTERCMRHTGLLELIRELVATGRTVASICTAARVLDAAGVLPDRYTCYPGVEEQLSNQHRSDELLVDTGSVITSQGPGTAMQFALYLAGKLSGEERRQVVAGSLLAN